MILTTAFRREVPTDLVKNLQFRLSLNDECSRSKRARMLIMRACADDPVFFINAFGWQTNPENFDEEDGPFICFPFQEEAIDKTIQWLLYDRRLVLWEKSRKQGGTMLALFLDVWLTNFHKRKRALVMSHNERAVERSGDEDTLFGKFDFILSHLPSWMQDGLPRLKGVYQFKKTKSQIVSSTTTVRSGVGGRTTKNTLDEVSKYQNAEAILSQLKDVGPILAIGTHYGVGGMWYDLCRRPDVSKIVMHWSKNPMYNKGLYRSAANLKEHERAITPNDPSLPPDYAFVTDGSPHGGFAPGIRSIYYDNLCRDRTPREIAIHWDIDPSGAARQFFNVHMLRRCIANYARPPEWEGEIEYEPNGKFKRLIPRENGPLRLWCRLQPDYGASKRWVSPSIYKVGGDIGAGTGATPSCLAGGDAMIGRKVLEYMHAGKSEPEFAKISRAVCELLIDPAGNPAQLVWDRTGPTGGKFGQAVVELGFRNFWYWRDEFKLNPQVSDTPGWFANTNSTMALFRDYNEALDKGWIENPSENALKECLAFEYVVGGNGIAHGESIRTEDPSAGRVNHSDMAYADALMWKLMKDAGGAKNPEERLEMAATAKHGWNADGPSFGYLLEQSNKAQKSHLGRQPTRRYR